MEFTVLVPGRMPEEDFTFFALTPRQYEAMARNMAEIRRWISEAKWRLEYYKSPVQETELEEKDDED